METSKPGAGLRPGDSPEGDAMTLIGRAEAILALTVRGDDSSTRGVIATFVEMFAVFQSYDQISKAMELQLIRAHSQVLTVKEALYS